MWTSKASTATKALVMRRITDKSRLPPATFFSKRKGCYNQLLALPTCNDSTSHHQLSCADRLGSVPPNCDCSPKYLFPAVTESSSACSPPPSKSVVFQYVKHSRHQIRSSTTEALQVPKKFSSVSLI